MVAPEIARLAGEEAGRWIVIKVNTEELPGPAQKYRISAIPTLIVFKNGREICPASGRNACRGHSATR